MNLRDQILNLEPPTAATRIWDEACAYIVGHRDARHAAAELALKADAEIERLRKDAGRWRWLADRLLAADFDYNGEGLCALVFELPAGCSVSADCDATIDAAMKAAA